jgi:flagellar biosynthesis/type III secretory pathway M-ring protein FliF/YscJ
MDQLRRVLENIRTQLGGLGATQKLLVGSLVVIMLMTLFLVTQYAGRSDMVPLLDGAQGQDLSRAARILRTSGITPEVQGSTLMVPAGSEDLAVARLAENRAMPADQSAILFNNLIEKQSWKNSRVQNEQLFAIATQNQLARWISDFSDIRTAEVVLDVPKPNGLGAGLRQPTAAVTVWTAGGSPVPQHTVDAIAELVSGARAGLETNNVRVIDGSSGRAMRPTDPNQVVPTTYLEHALKLEGQTRAKMLDLLGYIPGVQVAVSAQVDVTRRSSQEKIYHAENKGSQNFITRETGRSETQSTASRGAEPGVRSNQTADINRGKSSTGQSYETTDDESEFQAFPGFKTEVVDDPRGMATHLAVSINVPRGFVAAQLAPPAEEGQEPTPVSDDEVAAKFPEIERMIRDAVVPHVRTMTASSGLADDVIDSQVSISMIPIDVTFGAVEPQEAGFFGGGGSGGGGVLGIGGGLVDKIVLVGLAVFAVLMMVSMVKKAGRKVELPTAEELVGIPKALEPGSDIIGEADESDTPMTGIEVGDDELNTYKMLEQVNEMVVQDAPTAAKIVERWVAVED